MTKKLMQALKSQAHTLQARYQCGKHGITPTFITLLDRALTAHELIKISLLDSIKEEADAIATQLCITLKATCIDTVGHKLVLYRENPLKKTKKNA